jgi:hypothetical protein
MTPAKANKPSVLSDAQRGLIEERKDDASVQELWQTLDTQLRLNIGNSLKCGICLSTMTNPVRTPCVHAFCKDCIHASLMSGNKKCPECNTAITKRGLQPFGYLADLSDAYKTSLREFGMVPTTYNPNFTTMTQKVSSQDGDDEVSPQGQLDRLDAAMTWQQKALPFLPHVSQMQKSENEQVVAANHKACSIFLVRNELPTTQEVQEEAREQQWADDDWDQQQSEEDNQPDEFLTAEDETRRSRSRRVSFLPGRPTLINKRATPATVETAGNTSISDDAITPRQTNVTIAEESPSPDPFEAALSPIQVKYSQQPLTETPASTAAATAVAARQGSQPLSMPTPSPYRPDEKLPLKTPHESDNTIAATVTGPPTNTFSMPTPTPERIVQRSEITGMMEDSFGALHLLPGNQNLRNDTQTQDDDDDKENDDDDDKTKSFEVLSDHSFSNSISSPHSLSTEAAVTVTAPPIKDSANEPTQAAGTIEDVKMVHNEDNTDGKTDEETHMGDTSNNTRIVATGPGRSWNVGDIINVQPRTWPGVNKLGGVARISKINSDGSYDVTYVLGGKESGVDSVFIAGNDDFEDQQPINERRRRRTDGGELPMHLLQELEAEGFDTTGNRPIKTPKIKKQRIASSKMAPRRASAPRLRDSTNSATRQSCKKKTKSPKLATTPKISKSTHNKQQRLSFGKYSLPQSDIKDFVEVDANYSRILNHAAKNEKVINVVVSSIRPEDVEMLKKLCSKPLVNGTKLRLSDNFGQKSTICILPVDVDKKSGNVSPRLRTVKAMRAALAGIPMVSFEWIEQMAASKDKEVKLPPLVVRSLTVKSYQGSENINSVARLAVAKNRKFLSGVNIFLCGNFPTKQRTDMQILSKEAGAKLLKTPSEVAELLKKGKQPLVVICQNSNISPAPLEKRLRASLEESALQILIVQKDWLFDSISCTKALAPDNFAPPTTRHRLGDDLWKLCCAST